MRWNCNIMRCKHRKIGEHELQAASSNQQQNAVVEMSKSHDRFIIRSFYTSIFTSAKQQSKATMTLPMHIRRARARTRRRHLHNTHTLRALQCWLAAGRTQYQRIHDLVTDHGVCWVWRQKKWMRAENDSIEWANVIITITWIFNSKFFL